VNQLFQGSVVNFQVFLEWSDEGDPRTMERMLHYRFTFYACTGIGMCRFRIPRRSLPGGVFSQGFFFKESHGGEFLNSVLDPLFGIQVDQFPKSAQDLVLYRLGHLLRLGMSTA